MKKENVKLAGIVMGIIAIAFAIMPVFGTACDHIGAAIDKMEESVDTTNVVTYPAKYVPIKATRPFYGVDDFDAKQLKVCEDVLQECENAEILDAKGIERFHEIRHNPSVSQYIELISECELEDNFYDTVGEGDMWCIYIHHVLEPRGLAD